MLRKSKDAQTEEDCAIATVQSVRRTLEPVAVRGENTGWEDKHQGLIQNTHSSDWNKIIAMCTELGRRNCCTIGVAGQMVGANPL